MDARPVSETTGGYLAEPLGEPVALDVSHDCQTLNDLIPRRF